MPAYQIPPWVGQPADPAAHYQAGFQLGTHLGAQQAAQIFQQQQLARELQKDEFEAQKQNLSMQLQVDEAVRQHRATSAYQNMIASGVDPMEALKSVGPSMGIDPTRVMAMQEQRAERAAQQANLGAYRQSMVQQRGLDREERAREAAARQEQSKAALIARTQQEQVRRQQATQRMQQSLAGQISRDKTLNQLKENLDSAQATLRDLQGEQARRLASPSTWFDRSSDEIDKERKQTESLITEQQRKIQERMAELKGQFSEATTAVEPESAMPEQDQGMPQETAAPEETESAGADSGTQSNGTKRLRFRDGEFVPVE